MPAPLPDSNAKHRKNGETGYDPPSILDMGREYVVTIISRREGHERHDKDDQHEDGGDNFPGDLPVD